MLLKCQLGLVCVEDIGLLIWWDFKILPLSLVPPIDGEGVISQGFFLGEASKTVEASYTG